MLTWIHRSPLYKSFQEENILFEDLDEKLNYIVLPPFYKHKLRRILKSLDYWQFIPIEFYRYLWQNKDKLKPKILGLIKDVCKEQKPFYIHLLNFCKFANCHYKFYDVCEDNIECAQFICLENTKDLIFEANPFECIRSIQVFKFYINWVKNNRIFVKKDIIFVHIFRAILKPIEQREIIDILIENKVTISYFIDFHRVYIKKYFDLGTLKYLLEKTELKVRHIGDDTIVYNIKIDHFIRLYADKKIILECLIYNKFGYKFKILNRDGYDKLINEFIHEDTIKNIKFNDNDLSSLSLDKFIKLHEHGLELTEDLFYRMVSDCFKIARYIYQHIEINFNEHCFSQINFSCDVYLFEMVGEKYLKQTGKNIWDLPHINIFGFTKKAVNIVFKNGLITFNELLMFHIKIENLNFIKDNINKIGDEYLPILQKIRNPKIIKLLHSHYGYNINWTINHYYLCLNNLENFIFIRDYFLRNGEDVLFTRISNFYLCKDIMLYLIESGINMGNIGNFNKIEILDYLPDSDVIDVFLKYEHNSISKISNVSQMRKLIKMCLGELKYEDNLELLPYLIDMRISVTSTLYIAIKFNIEIDEKRLESLTYVSDLHYAYEKKFNLSEQQLKHLKDNSIYSY